MPLQSEPVHFTNLKKFALSAAHYAAACDSPAPVTPSMRFGSLVHHVYAGESVLVYQGERKGNKWKDFAEMHKGKEIFTIKERDKAMRCAASLHKNPNAVEVLRGDMEREILWRYLNRSCSSRLDVLGADYVTDLKTTNCAEPGRFWRAAKGRFAYHAQLAFYSLAATHIGRTIRDRYIVAVESAPPFDVVVLRLKARAILEGEKLVRGWFERLLMCEASNDWPGYAQCILDVDVEEDLELTIDGESFDVTEAA